MNTENNIEIGDRIKEIRIQRGIKQKDLAKILDMPVSTLANYETNRRPVSLETLKKISEALEVPLESILGIKTMDVRYYKLNQITEEFERVGNDLREKLKEAKELEKKERIICITKTDAWDEKYINSLKKLKFREPKTQIFLIYLEVLFE